MLNVMIGWDPSESIAAQVLAHSITSRASMPVAITMLRRDQLRHLHTRDRHPLQSTEFAFTRFLTPYLAGSLSTHAVFLDCDMLCLDDIYQMLACTSDEFAPVSVVKHEHKPHERTKMRGQVQTQYSMKNWSSVMLFFLGHQDCRNLTPEIVDTWDGLDLHQFKWVTSNRIARLGHRWNHLVGYDPDVDPSEISLIHWTNGGPWWDKYRNTSYADLWFEEKRKMELAYERTRAAA